MYGTIRCGAACGGAVLGTHGAVLGSESRGTSLVDCGGGAVLGTSGAVLGTSLVDCGGGAVPSTTSRAAPTAA